MTPAHGPLRIIGGPSVGCIAGAAELPPQGAGYQGIHLRQSHFWGAPSTVAAMQALGREVRAAGLGDVYVEEISRPRGGPIGAAHVSHQMGLDIDVGLDTSPKRALDAAERERVELPSLVRPDRRGVREDRWNEGVVTLLRLATQLPGLDRVLVNPAIKRKLCESVTGDRSWLRRIRPWYGHAAHMHVHFACPAGQSECIAQPPPPPGDGCDASLQWWFDQLDAPPRPAKPARPSPRPKLPAACVALLGER